MAPWGAGERFVPDYLLLKLASRCNINCTYCYWFRDPSVYAKPALLTEDAHRALVRGLRRHVEDHSLGQFSILMHGGEPLMFGKVRMRGLLEDLRGLEDDLRFRLNIRITTNGVLIDDEWAAILREANVGVTVSLDGPEAIHDKSRLDFRSRGTHSQVINGLEILRRAGLDPGVLAVCDPSSDARSLLRYFADTVGVDFDVLVPDATHEDRPPSIARFYRDLFDEWYDNYADRGVEIRFLSSVVKGLLGVPSHSESIGMGEITTMTMLTDGSLEALDILRTTRMNITRSELNIATHPLDAINDDPLWNEVRVAAVNLAEPCRACPYNYACGGGHIASRWSPERRFDNPSVYCEDFKVIFAHAWERLSADISVETPDRSIPLLQS